MDKRIYIDKSIEYLNQSLAKLIMNEQFSVQDKNNFYRLKIMYVISKVQLHFEL